jgi:hypothetical protein
LKPETSDLFKTNLQSPVFARADRFGRQVAFLLQSKMDNAPLGRVQNSESKRSVVFANVLRGKPSHCLQFGFARAPETVGIAHKTLRAVEFSAVDLKQSVSKASSISPFSMSRSGAS